MKTVQELTTFILGSLKDENGGRVALYHYLRNFFKPDGSVTPQLINQFYREALLLSHWQEKQIDLGTDTFDLLQNYYQNDPEFIMGDLLKPQELQLLSIKTFSDMKVIVEETER